MEELIERSDLNLAEFYREQSRRSGGTVLDEDGLVLYTSAHPLPVLVNGVLRLDARLPAETVLSRAHRFFRAHRRGFTVWIRTHADADLERAAAATGLRPMGDDPGMVLDHRLPDADPPEGVSLRRVDDEHGAADFAAVNSAAYATYGAPLDLAPTLFARPESLVGPHLAAFVAYADGAPAAAAMTMVSHGVAGIYWVGTVPESRGRGLAELVTRAAGNAGFDRGASVAALQASTMGEPLYRRMGYVAITRYRQLVRFEPPD
ncbi:MAG: GNAT family N-acetyltransferase [Acidimicrobiia bacterium]|nr:GNAT family N-acetyltransferase [Acidimicrobiia bacterium]